MRKKEVMDKMIRSVLGGLCQMTANGKHTFLEDIKELALKEGGGVRSDQSLALHPSQSVRRDITLGTVQVRSFRSAGVPIGAGSFMLGGSSI